MADGTIKRGMVLLWEGNISAQGNSATLSQSMFNFDSLILVCLANSQIYSIQIPVESSGLGLRKTLSCSTDAINTGFTYNCTINFSFTNETTVTIESKSQNSVNWGAALRQIYGIKY